MTTDCLFLQNELFDVVRMFRNRPEQVEHTFRFDGGRFFNAFVVDGERYEFSDEAEFSDETEFKRQERRFAKLALYLIMEKRTGESLPWGALTGIRPTKLAYSELEAGRPFRPLLEKMRVCDENIRLVEEVLKTQEGIYEKKDGNTDYFVSLPFCPSKCEYCSFITAPIDKTRGFVEGYIGALEKEIDASRELVGNLRSVYIGGGTPFALDTKDLERVLCAVDKIRKNGCEYTVEAGRPDVFTKEKMDLLLNHGVTRICINPQSFLNSTLEKIGRKHTEKDLETAFELAKNYPFEVNVDLIAGLADEKEEDFAYSLSRAIETGAENITVHCLCLKAGARLKEETDTLDVPVVSKMVEYSRNELRKAGYAPYYMYRQKYQAGNAENVGWTKKDKACVYNIDIMEEVTDNLAVGANSVSKKVYNAQNRIERYGTQKDLKTYIEKIDATIKAKREFFLR